MFSDEVVERLRNKQNHSKRRENNAQLVLQAQLHPEEAMYGDLYKSRPGIIMGPYFFDNDAGANVTMDDARYRSIFVSKFEWHRLEVFWFQQYDARPHAGTATIDLFILNKNFGI